MVNYAFCACGRLKPCKWHDGKEEKPKLKKQPRYSGDSKFRQEEGQFQAKIRD